MKKALIKALALAEQLGIEKTTLGFGLGSCMAWAIILPYNLAEAGYNVAKYILWTGKDVMPYLIRRAEENTSVAGQTSRGGY